MIDTWMRSGSSEALAEVCARYENVLGISGREGFFYACVRASAAVEMSPENGCEIITPEAGAAILGVWA